MGLTNPFVRGYVIPVWVPWVWCVVLRGLEDLSEGLWVRLWVWGKKEGEEGRIQSQGGRRRRWSSKSIRAFAARIMDDDRLEDRHWNTEMREVELWENERWNSTGSSNPTSPTTSTSTNTDTTNTSISDSSATINGIMGSGCNAGGEGGGAGADAGGGWGKSYLRGSAERSAWTRGRDGWSAVGEDGSGEVRSVFHSLPRSPFLLLNLNN